MKTLFLLLMLGISEMGISQNYLDKIAKSSCSCVSETKEIEDKSEKQMALGLCILQGAEPFSKELMRDYDIDFNNIDEDGEKLGKLIGVKMVRFCPEVFEAMSDEDEESEVFVFEGKVSGINKKGFVYFTIKNDEGRSSKYYWLTYVASEIDIANNFESFSGKNVLVKYRVLEIFDPKINDYRNINVLVSLNL